MADLPRDSDGNALRQLALDGSDLSKPLKIDFAVDVPSREVGNAIASLVSGLGFEADVFHDDESDTWTCYCIKEMVPSYDEVVATQKQLDELSRPLGGKSDGWGSFGNAQRDYGSAEGS